MLLILGHKFIADCIRDEQNSVAKLQIYKEEDATNMQLPLFYLRRSSIRYNTAG